MSRTLCESGKKGKKKKDAKYICKKCGGEVKKKDRVCKPSKIKN